METLEPCTVEKATEEEYLELQNQIKHIHGELDETQSELNAMQTQGSMWEESATSSWVRIEQSERANHELMITLSNMIQVKNAREVELQELIKECTETKEHEMQIIHGLKHDTEVMDVMKKTEIDELQELLSKLEEELKQKDVEISRQEEALQLERNKREVALVVREKKQAAKLQNLQARFKLMKEVVDDQQRDWKRSKLLAVIGVAIISCVVGRGLDAFWKRFFGSKRAQSVLATVIAIVFLASDPMATLVHKRPKKI